MSVTTRTMLTDLDRRLAVHLKEDEGMHKAFQDALNRNSAGLEALAGEFKELSAAVTAAAIHTARNTGEQKGWSKASKFWAVTFVTLACGFVAPGVYFVLQHVFK